MSFPNHVFIDTCILDQLRYNFESEKVLSFIEASQKSGVVLLLPDPTSREIDRHIHDRADEALKALKEAVRKAPFLRKWKEWPIRTDEVLLDRQILDIARKEWAAFLEKFQVKRLDYPDLNISIVMDWYNEQKAPFGKGKKRKEFPDAMSFAILLLFAKREKCSIALISSDQDFKNACHLYQEFRYFDSLQAFTQALHSSDRRMQVIRKALESNSALLIEAISDKFYEITFYHELDSSAEIEDIRVIAVEIKDTKIIAIDGTQCTIAFEAFVEFSANVNFNDPDFSGLSGTLDTAIDISGILKLGMGDQGDCIRNIELITLDEDDVELTEDVTPYEDQDSWD